MPVLVKVSATEPEASMVPPAVVPRVKRWSLLAAPPVYWSVPPLRTRLAAALVEAPRLLLLPPFASTLVERMPALTVVGPV